MWIPRWFLVLLGAMALFLGVVIFGLHALNAGLCGNEVLATDPAPSRSYNAILFVRSCGTTTSFGTNVSVLDTSDRLGDEAGNIFVVDATRNRSVATNRIGGPQVAIQWLPGDTLVVRYPSGVDIHKQVLIEHGIHVHYEEIH